MKVSRSEVNAFRLHAHHLTDRVEQHRLLDVVGASGIQNSPPGSALLSLHARAQGVSQELVDKRVGDDKNLLQSWCMRGSPFFFPTRDAPVFTTGVLPPTEETMRQFIRGASPSVDELELSLTEVVELTRAEIGTVLTGRRLAIDELGAAIAERVADTLPTKKRRLWNQEGPHAAGQPLGEAIVHFCIRILTLQGVVCLAPREDNAAPFVLVEEWLGTPIPDVDPETPRAELLRRYLHCYGPSTKADFAKWLGVRAGDAEPWWGLVEDELTPINFGRKTWMLTDDVDALQTSPPMQGLRLLPPRDPYTQLRDRETIVDKKFHKTVWKPVGDPGTVLSDGAIIGTWRPRKNGNKFRLVVAPFDRLTARVKEDIEHEAKKITALRGATDLTLDFEP